MVIGITGGIGSGKSTIARELAQRGYPVYDCDREAKRIIAGDQEVQKAIIRLLGDEAFCQGRYNTSYVAQRVFRDPELLDKLNQLVHPAVIRDIQNHPSCRIENGLFFIESAILYEAGIDKLCDKIIVVEAPEDIRIARTIARDYCGKATPDNINKVRARIHAQARSYAWDIKKPIVISNDGQCTIPELVSKLLESTKNKCL